MPSTYHVCGTCGNDTNDGTTAAWLTIDKSTSVADDDDVVKWHSGTYREKPVCDNNASVGHPITFQAVPDEPCPFCTVPPRGRVRITGCDVNEQARAGVVFNYNDKTYVNVVGNRGLWVDGDGTSYGMNGGSGGNNWTSSLSGAVVAGYLSGVAAIGTVTDCVGTAQGTAFLQCKKVVGCISVGGNFGISKGAATSCLFANCLALGAQTSGIVGDALGQIINCGVVGSAYAIAGPSSGVDVSVRNCWVAFCTGYAYVDARKIAPNYSFCSANASTRGSGDAVAAGYNPDLNLHALLGLAPLMSVAGRDKGINNLCSPKALTSAAGAVGTITVSTGWLYKVTFVDAAGETEGGVASANLTFSNKVGASLSAIPIGPPSVTARKVYRTVDGGADYYLLTNGLINDNTTTTLVDTTTDATLTGNAAMPAANTTAIYGAADTDILGLLRMMDGDGNGTATPDIGPWECGNWSISRAAADIYSAGPAYICNAEGQQRMLVFCPAGNTITVTVWTKLESGTSYGRISLRGTNISTQTDTATGTAYEQLTVTADLASTVDGGEVLEVILYARAQGDVDTYFSDFAVTIAPTA